MPSTPGVDGPSCVVGWQMPFSTNGSDAGDRSHARSSQHVTWYPKVADHCGTAALDQALISAAALDLKTGSLMWWTNGFATLQLREINRWRVAGTPARNPGVEGGNRRIPARFGTVDKALQARGSSAAY